MIEVQRNTLMADFHQGAAIFVYQALAKNKYVFKEICIVFRV